MTNRRPALRFSSAPARVRPPDACVDRTKYVRRECVAWPRRFVKNTRWRPHGPDGSSSNANKVSARGTGKRSVRRSTGRGGSRARLGSSVVRTWSRVFWAPPMDPNETRGRTPVNRARKSYNTVVHYDQVHSLDRWRMSLLMITNVRCWNSI